MSPRFAAAVDPIILYVLHVLERIERNEPVDPADEKIRILGRIKKAEEDLGNSEEWNHAKYALVAWAEDSLKEAPWHGSEYFVMNSLEFETFGTREYHTQFYTRAKEAAAAQALDALETYYICVVLGFRGLYAEAGEEELAPFLQDLDLPTSIEAWAKQTSSQIKYGLGRKRAEARPLFGDGAPPLEARFQLLGWSAVCLVLATVVGFLAYSYFDLF